MINLSLHSNEISLKLFNERNNKIDVSLFKREINSDIMYSSFLKSVYNYDKNRSFLKIDFENNYENGLKLFLEVEVYQSFGIFLEDKTYFLPVVDLKNIDQNLPYNTYLKYGVFSLGRGPINWGPGKYSNLIISDASKYFDYFSIDNKFGNIRFRYVLIGLDPYLSEGEEKIQKEIIDLNSGNKNYSERVKMIAAHRLDWEIIKGLTLSLTESSVIGGQYPDIKMINPLFFYHSTFTEGYSNVIEGFDVEWKNGESRVYLSTAVDEWINAFDKSNDYKPPAMAYLGGGAFKIAGIKIDCEYARTTKWMYNRWQEYLKFTNRRQIVSTYGKTGRYAVDYPIGFYLGPDAESATISLDFNPFSIKVENINKGALSTRSKYNESKNDENWFSLSGVVERSSITTITYRYQDFILSLENDEVRNYGNVEGVIRNDIIVSAGYTYKF